MDDFQSSDITYTYDYNHYGTPKIIEDTWTVPGHTNVHVIYEVVYTNNSGWSAYTAIPAGPIPPTAGHQFTNPGTNFGGEHFGVGFRVQPTKALYFWLLDTGNHALSRGGQVTVSTAFSMGAAVPVLRAAVAPASWLLWLVPGLAIVLLGNLGAVAARADGASAMRGAVRLCFWGSLAMGLTAQVGRLFGISV